MGNCALLCKVSDPVADSSNNFHPEQSPKIDLTILENAKQTAILDRGDKETSSLTKPRTDTDLTSFEPIKSKTKLEKLQLDQGITYEGELLFGKRNGKGIQSWPDGSLYEGEWKDDKACGKGKLTFGNGDCYEGEWKEDKANGKGVFVGKNGAKYTGDWKNDKKHGKGVEGWPDGASYDGEYVNGFKTGVGKIVFSDGSWYEGHFFENEIDGYGTYFWANEKKHEGEWKDNKMHGHGKTTYLKTNDEFEGVFLNDKRHGLGKHKDCKGNIKIGYWMNGKENGKFIQVKGGKNEKEEWKDGEKIRNCDKDEGGFEEILKILEGK